MIVAKVNWTWTVTLNKKPNHFQSMLGYVSIVNLSCYHIKTPDVDAKLGYDVIKTSTSKQHLCLFHVPLLSDNSLIQIHILYFAQLRLAY